MKKVAVQRLIPVLLLILISIAGWFLFGSDKKHKRPDPYEAKRLSGKDELISFSGRILQYAGNARGDIDKILIDDGQNQRWLHFPPHTARQVLGIALLNTKIFVTIHTPPKPESKALQEFEMVSIKPSESAADLNIREISPPSPKNGLEVEIKGNKAGRPEEIHDAEQAFTLDGNLISIPPHMAPSLFRLLENAKVIVVKGFKRDSSDGFVKISGLPYVKPYSIQIDSVTYMVR